MSTEPQKCLRVRFFEKLERLREIHAPEFRHYYFNANHGNIKNTCFIGWLVQNKSRQLLKED